MDYPESFDVIVIGGGHAGVEAALASARMGKKTMLLTHNIETVGQLSCNPSIGGIGKSHLVKEIDALGGAMALAADKSGIHFKVLNASKGAAVQALRVQVDRTLYKKEIRKMVENQNNLQLFQAGADDLIIEKDKVCGVITQMGIKIKAKTVVLTAGTFLGGKIHVGMENHSGGRAGDPAAISLAARLRELKLPVSRLKTGTPPRLDGRTIDFDKLGVQEGDGIADGKVPVFSYWGDRSMHPRQVSCYITHTNPQTHEILRKGFDRSPMFTGQIEGIGPRYCPSIEDKINRFKGKDSHQIFLEPEGLDTNEYYPNGVSTSLPFDIQYEAIRSIVGLEKAHILRAGYAIEYDYFDPRGLRQSLETRAISGLFFAGQINGTTGYEEAASQGIMAGINAARLVDGLNPWVPGRDEAYLGVLIDDLTTKGVTEPYRMFTSRAEYRLQLREQNADMRLSEKAKEMGLLDDKQYNKFLLKKEFIEKIGKNLEKNWVNPGSMAGEDMRAWGFNLTNESRLSDVLKRPEINYRTLFENKSVGKALKEYTVESLESKLGEELTRQVIQEVEVGFKYAGYIEKQKDDVKKIQAIHSMSLPDDFNYDEIKALSTEVKQKLNLYKPKTLGEASKISGVPPPAIEILLIYLKKKELIKREKAKYKLG